MGDTITISIPGLEKLNRLPGAIEHGQRAFVDRLCHGLADEIRAHIRRRSGELASHWRGHGLDATHGVIQASGPAYLKASVRGSYSRAKKGKVLRFVVNGEVLFRPWVRSTPGDYAGKPGDRKISYVTLALKNRRAVAEREFEATFGRLEGT